MIKRGDKNQLPGGWNSRLSENLSASQVENFLNIENQIVSKKEGKDLLKRVLVRTRFKTRLTKRKYIEYFMESTSVVEVSEIKRVRLLQ